MKKYISVALLAFALVAPSTLFAQSDIDPNPNSSNCITLNSSNLRYRSRDAQTNGEVSSLQDFLQEKGYLNSEPTGYFGLMTVAAVTSFQTSSGIQGTGYVGPLTRAQIHTTSCGMTSVNPVIPAPVACTMDARMCSDGSYVSRSGPRCEFKACPNSQPTNPTIDPRGCASGTVYSTTTGEKCNKNLLDGCNSTSGFSSTTGQYCDGSHPQTNPAPDPVPTPSPIDNCTTGGFNSRGLRCGCDSNIGYGTRDGMSCSTNPTPAPVPAPAPAPETCTNSGFSSVNGFRCGCASDVGFSSVNGESCSVYTPVPPPKPVACVGFESTTGLRCGCTTNSGWSLTTGLACGADSYIQGCSSTSGWSTTTGESCAVILTPQAGPVMNCSNPQISNSSQCVAR